MNINRVKVNKVSIDILQDQIEEILQENRNVFAVLDACDSRPVQELVANDTAGECLPLYRGKAIDELVSVAPFLVSLSVERWNWIATTLWGTAFGFIAFTDQSAEQIRRHLRRFLLVTGPKGESLYFRYYDPRVLHLFLESGMSDKVDAFVAPFTTLYLQNSDNDLICLTQEVPAQSPSFQPYRFTQVEMDTMAEHRRKKFVERLGVHLDQSMTVSPRRRDPRWIQEQIEVGVRRAHHYELHEEDVVARYIEIVVSQLGGFQPKADPLWAANLLHDRRLNLDERLSQFEQACQSNAISNEAIR